MEKANDNFKKIKQLLKNPLINKPEIYKQLGVGRGYFHDMLHQNNGKSFKEDHIEKIGKILKSLKKQLVGL